MVVLSYKIRIKTLDGENLTFNNVKKYEAKDGLIYFIDSKTKIPKIFPVSQVNSIDQKGDSDEKD